jgi:SAM-dependent methyltransferase
MNETHIRACLAGDMLYGDDFGPEDVYRWFADEREAYANLGAKDRDKYRYGYHALNTTHCYRHLARRTFDHALGFGSAYGAEFLPVIDRIARITILEPSDSFSGDELCGVPLAYRKPRIDGALDFPDESFDLITCFGVLHHVPNVTRVAGELSRCLRADGYLLIREPTVSMGDWRKPRAGLTKHERGIPLAVLPRILADTGLEMIRHTRCMFALTSRLAPLARQGVYNTTWTMWVDRVCCALFAFNRCYHATTPAAKLRPSAVALVLRKPASGQPGRRRAKAA